MPLHTGISTNAPVCPVIPHKKHFTAVYEQPSTNMDRDVFLLESHMLELFLLWICFLCMYVAFYLVADWITYSPPGKEAEALIEKSGCLIPSCSRSLTERHSLHGPKDSRLVTSPPASSPSCPRCLQCVEQPPHWSPPPIPLLPANTLSITVFFSSKLLWHLTYLSVFFCLKKNAKFWRFLSHKALHWLVFSDVQVPEICQHFSSFCCARKLLTDYDA